MFGTSGDNCYLRGGDESSLVYIYRISTQPDFNTTEGALPNSLLTIINTLKNHLLPWQH